MSWNVIFHPEFEEWFYQQATGLQDAITAYALRLKDEGPALGRPRVDTLKGSKLPNLKELRVQYRGNPWRILFAFDPKRQAILLVGGNKQGDKKWYKDAIDLAEKRYQEHLMEQENGKKSG